MTGVAASAAELDSPYPYHGGKRLCAHLVWPRFGAVPNYIEPFFGSGAVWLLRPGGAGKIETLNDIDGGVVNFWRAVEADPDEVARWCDWPVTELDLHARHTWLINQLSELSEQLRADPHFYDAKVAGWWVWGISLWIGSGWCSFGDRRRPHIADYGHGVHKSSVRKRPELMSAGRGVHRQSWQQRPQLGSENGVHRKMSIGNDRGIHGVSAPPVREWFRALKERSRYARFLCGDWRRVVTPAVLGKGKNVGGRRPTAVFLDPPYKTELRTKRLYGSDEEGLSAQVREWAIEHGDDPDLRIALCGYEGEHEMPDDWTVVAWKGRRGHAGANNENRLKERIWFSPHCLREQGAQRSLF